MSGEAPRPIACTLSPDDLRDRSAVWRELLDSGQVWRSEVPGGIRLQAFPAAEKRLMELIDLERACCAWIDFEIRPDATVTLTAAGEGQAVLAGMFRPSPAP